LKPQNFSELKSRLDQIEQQFKSTKFNETQLSLSPIEKDLTSNLNWKDQLPQKKYPNSVLESNSLSSACQSLERSLTSLFGFGAFTSLYELGSTTHSNAIPTIVALSSTLKSLLTTHSKFESISLDEMRIRLTSESGGVLKIKLETDSRELTNLMQVSQKYFDLLKSRSKLIQSFDLTSFQDNEASYLSINFAFNLDVLSEKAQPSTTRIDV
jgi:hypothetical protein